MTHEVPQVAPGESLPHVAHRLRTSRCDAIVVIDALEHLLGIITMVDVVTAVALGTAGLPVPTDSELPESVAVENGMPKAAAGAPS